MNVLNNPMFIIMACLTIGLAPYTPEPHIVANLRWVLGGANGMEAMNWFDLAMHGTPWLLLIRLGVLKVYGAVKARQIS